MEAASENMKLAVAVLCKRYGVAISTPSNTASASLATGSFLRSAYVKSLDLHVTILRSISFLYHLPEDKGYPFQKWQINPVIINCAKPRRALRHAPGAP